MYLRRWQKDRSLASNILLLLLFGPINYTRPDTLRRIPESLVFGILVTITIHHLVSTTILQQVPHAIDKQKHKWLRLYDYTLDKCRSRALANA